MIRELLHTAYNTVLHNQNQFASGGLVLMLIGGIVATLHSIPVKIWAWIVHQTTVTLSITDDQQAYYWMKLWLENQRIMKRTRHMDVYNKGTQSYAVVPAPGHHWMLYRGRIISATFFRSDEKKALGSLSLNIRSESVVLKTIGRKQDVFRKLMEDVFAQFVKQEEKKPELYAWGSWGDWQQIHAFQPRKIDTVILPEEDKNNVIQEIVEFKAKREWYAEMGIPYRKGLLFYGPPGTGKTSLVTGLSSYFNADVYILKLADMSDASLMEASKNVEPNSFLIVEDIDSVRSSHSRTKKSKDGKAEKSGVSLSGLLNVLDGLLSPYGAIFILTTNHKEALDAALIRPGRVDLQLLITYADAKQKQTLYNRFFEGACPQKYLDKRMTMADLQQALMVEKRGVN